MQVMKVQISESLGLVVDRVVYRSVTSAQKVLRLVSIVNPPQSTAGFAICCIHMGGWKKQEPFFQKLRMLLLSLLSPSPALTILDCPIRFPSAVRFRRLWMGYLRDRAEGSVIKTAGAWNKIQILVLILAKKLQWVTLISSLHCNKFVPVCRVNV